MQVLVGYASAHGSTREIADRVAGRLRSLGIPSDCRAMGEVADLEGYDAAVLGSAIHNQAWLPEATGLLDRLGGALARRPVWLFSVGMPGALPGRLKRWTMQEEGLVGEQLRTKVQAREHRLFSGVVRREHLGAPGRARFLLMGGRFGDYRDWPAIEAFADAVAAGLGARPNEASL